MARSKARHHAAPGRTQRRPATPPREGSTRSAAQRRRPETGSTRSAAQRRRPEKAAHAAPLSDAAQRRGAHAAAFCRPWLIRERRRDELQSQYGHGKHVSHSHARAQAVLLSRRRPDLLDAGFVELHKQVLKPASSADAFTFLDSAQTCKRFSADLSTCTLPRSHEKTAVRFW